MSSVENNKPSIELISEIRKIIGKPMPIEIKNPEAYLEHLKYKNHPIHKVKIKIGEKTLDITVPYVTIKMHMRQQGLSEDDEQMVKALKIKKEQMSLVMKANGALRKAYGTIVNNNGDKVEVRNIFDPVKQKLIEVFGRMFTTKEAHEICLKEWKMTVSFQQLADFRRANQTEIHKLIEEHQRTYSDIRLGHKRSRLEELVWLYNDRKRIYETTKKPDDHRLLLTTLKDIKSEAEGDVIRIDGGINVNINETVEHHIHQNLLKTISIKEIILSRVAAKSGINPITVINSINKSLYRKAIEAEDIDHVEMPTYPSMQTYDFNKIKLIQDHSEKLAEADKIKEATVDPVKETTGNTLKALLLKKLSEKIGDNYAKNTVTGHLADKNDDK
jgi:hypothetical protein